VAKKIEYTFKLFNIHLNIKYQKFIIANWRTTLLITTKNLRNFVTREYRKIITETNNLTCKFSTRSMLFKAKLRYSSFLRRLTFSIFAAIRLEK